MPKNQMLKFCVLSAILAGCSEAGSSGGYAGESATEYQDAPKKYEGAPITLPGAYYNLVVCSEQNTTEAYANAFVAWGKNISNPNKYWFRDIENCSVVDGSDSATVNQQPVVQSGIITASNLMTYNMGADCYQQDATRAVAFWLVGMDSSAYFEIPGHEREPAVMKGSKINGSCLTEITEYDILWLQEAAKKYGGAPIGG